MFFKRPFFIILVISLSWHLFWLAAISPVILPDNFPVKDYRPVNFLGPLFREVAKPPIPTDEPTLNSSLKKSIEAVTAAIHPESEEAAVLESKKITEPPFNLKGEKSSPDIVPLVNLSEAKQADSDEELRQNKGIKYSVSKDGRVFLLNRPLTNSEPEDDVLNIRNLWQKRFFH